MPSQSENLKIPSHRIANALILIGVLILIISHATGTASRGLDILGTILIVGPWSYSLGYNYATVKPDLLKDWEEYKKARAMEREVSGIAGIDAMGEYEAEAYDLYMKRFIEHLDKKEESTEPKNTPEYLSTSPTQAPAQQQDADESPLFGNWFQ